MPVRLLSSGPPSDYKPLGADGIAIHQVADKVRAAIARLVDGETADMLAISQVSESGDRLDWHCARPGKVVPIAAASPGERTDALARIANARSRVEAIGRAFSVERGERRSYGKQLLNAFSYPDEKCVFLVGELPVITFWGFEPQPPASAPISVAPPAASPEPATLQDLLVRRAPGGWGRRWVLAPLALLPLLLLGFWMVPDAVDRIACAIPVSSLNAPSRVVMLLDTSGSMALPLEANADEMREIVNAVMHGDVPAILKFQALVAATPPEATRLGAARRAMSTAVEAIPGSAEIGLITFGACGIVDDRGVFSASQRPALLQTMSEIQPASGTPLASGLEAAARLESASGRTVITLISDGAESCGGDPCAVARALKQTHPKLSANVIDISGEGGATCVAEATGGRVFTPSKMEDFLSSIGQATTGCQ
jgi:hypothetical protein